MKTKMYLVLASENGVMFKTQLPIENYKRLLNRKLHILYLDIPDMEFSDLSRLETKLNLPHKELKTGESIKKLNKLTNKSLDELRNYDD